MRALLLAALAAVAAPAAAQLPTGPLVVVAAPRHPGVSNAAAAYRADDPQLVGRLVSFANGGASFDGDYKECAQVAATTTRVPAGRLLRQLLPDQPSHGRSVAVTSADLGLTIAPAAPVTATRLRCVAPRVHGEDWTGATLFPIGGGRWGLSLIQDQLLILAPAGPVRASFDCARAASSAERTICADPVLAGWDVSVARAFREGRGDRDAQRAWLAERDKCGADRDCLHESMSTRVMNLLH